MSERPPITTSQALAKVGILVLQVDQLEVLLTEANERGAALEQALAQLTASITPPEPAPPEAEGERDYPGGTGS